MKTTTIETGRLIERIGLDEVKLTGLQFVRVEDYFDPTLPEIRISREGRTKFGPEELGLDFSRLLIRIGSLGATLEAKFTGSNIGSKTNVGIITLTITVGKGETRNLQNLSWAELKERVLCVQEVLADTYGVVINLQEARFSYMEISTTFHFDAFDACRRFMGMLIKQYPGLKHITENAKNTRHADEMTVYSQKTAFTAKNESRKIKFYDKTFQLQKCHGIAVPKHFIRVEYTLEKPRVIESELRVNRFLEMEEVDIIDCFERYVIIPSTRFARETYEARAQKYIRKAMATVTCSPKTAAYALSQLAQPRAGTDVATVLDICELSTYLKASDPSHWRARYQSYCETAVHASPVLLNGDYERFHRFVDKLEHIYDSMLAGAPVIYKW